MTHRSSGISIDIPGGVVLTDRNFTDKNFDFSRDKKNRGRQPLSSSHFPFSECHAISSIIIACDLPENYST